MPDPAERYVVRVSAPDARSRVRVVELAGGYSRTTSRDVLTAAGVTDGDELAEAELEDAIDSSEPDAARARAIRILAYRERSTAEVYRSLIQDGYPQSAAGAVRDRLVETGLIDDGRFADAYVRSKSAAGWGRGRIARHLADLGITNDLAQQSLDEIVPDESELDRALAQLGTSDLSDRRTRERILRRLVSRGFSYATALDVLSRGLEEGPAGVRNEFES